MVFFFQIQKAYDKCFGQDYSFDDLADTDGRDSDNDDLPDEYEGALLKIVKRQNINTWLSGNEACFYETMEWVKGNKVQPSVIEVK